ncbi:HABP4 protein, partial [Atractosteus spatula]|nr:HABP4 protein [Atractosteus spatula]
MKGVVTSPVSTAMQESFGCAVMNRFDQLLDDEADPFDILREAEEEKKKRKKKEESKKGSGGTAKPGKKESQKDRKVPVFLGGEALHSDSAAVDTVCAGLFSLGRTEQRYGTVASSSRQQPPRAPGLLGQNENRGTEVKVVYSERREVFRERRPNELEAPLDFSVEKPSDQFDRGMRGRGGRGRGGRGGTFFRSFDGFDQRGKREFERHSGSDRAGIRPEEKRGGGGPRNWGSVKDEMSDMEHGVPNEEAGDTEEAHGAPEGDAENQGTEGEGEAYEDYVAEMTLDEWKALQEQNRPKKEFNIRKPETSVPSKAVVIHKSKYLDVSTFRAMSVVLYFLPIQNLKEESDEDDEDHHFFRRPANDITTQLDINFGSLSRQGRGGRGGRGGRRGRGAAARTEATATPPPPPPRAEVVCPLLPRGWVLLSAAVAPAAKELRRCEPGQYLDGRLLGKT